jgi:hypothetical protein
LELLIFYPEIDIAKKLLGQAGGRSIAPKALCLPHRTIYVDGMRCLSLFNGKRQSGLAITKFRGAVVG